MKQLLRIAALAGLLITAFSVAGQTHYVPRVYIGGRAGVSMGRVEFSPSVPEKFLMGTTGAVTFRFTEEKLFGLVAELGWTQRGWKEDFEESPLSYSRTLTYINLPVMTQIIFGSRRFKCFVNLGPQVGFMIANSIKANFDVHDLGNVSDWPERKRMTEQLAMEIKNKFDYGIAGGLGFEFYVTPRQSITVEGRYYYGLGNIFPSSKADTFSASRCMTLAVTIGYNFRLK